MFCLPFFISAHVQLQPILMTCFIEYVLKGLQRTQVNLLTHSNMFHCLRVSAHPSQQVAETDFASLTEPLRAHTAFVSVMIK